MLTRAVGAWILIGLPVVAARVWWSVPAALTIFRRWSDGLRHGGRTLHASPWAQRNLTVRCRRIRDCLGLVASPERPLGRRPARTTPRRCPNRLACGDVGVVAAYRAAVPIGGDRA
jgi:hypothetical protein